MTTYTFTPTNSSQTFYQWDNPATWVPTGVPNSADADVVIPTVTRTDGSIFRSNIGTNSQSFAINSLTVTNNHLFVSLGTLAVAGNVALLTLGELTMSNGVLTAASLTNARQIDGKGQITVSGALTNTGDISGSGLTVTAQQLNNTGSITGGRDGGLTLNVPTSGFGNTLQGDGTYAVTGGPDSQPGELRLNLGGLITTNATKISMSNGEIFSFDAASSSYIPIESTLNLISPTGSLSLSRGGLFEENYNWIALTNSGLITVEEKTTLSSPRITVTGDLKLENGILATPQLIVDSNGHVEGGGTINGAIANSGVITAQVDAMFGVADFPDFNKLTINGSVEVRGSSRSATLSIRAYPVKQR